jgi:hypothetical protein
VSFFLAKAATKQVRRKSQTHKWPVSSSLGGSSGGSLKSHSSPIRSAILSQNTSTRAAALRCISMTIWTPCGIRWTDGMLKSSCGKEEDGAACPLPSTFLHRRRLMIWIFYSAR